MLLKSTIGLFYCRYLSSMRSTQQSQVCFAYVYVTKYTPGIYLSNIKSGSTKAMCGVCSKLTIETPEKRQ